MLGFALFSGAEPQSAASPDESLRPPGVGSTEPGSLRARAVLINVRGNEVGIAILTQEANAVRIGIDIHSSLHPGAKGFHIHAVGSCEPPDFASAGDHFNPTRRAHGFGHPQGGHAGDLANLEAESAYGLVDANLTNPHVTLRSGQPNSLMGGAGTSLVVHADYDDYVTQPAGNAGPAVACGVIEPF